MSILAAYFATPRRLAGLATSAYLSYGLPVEKIMARKMHTALEAVHGMIYFAPEAATQFMGLGEQDDRTGYFAGRAAPMGAVSSQVVTATFYNFNPALVDQAMAGAWELADPADWTAARMRGVDGAMRRFFGEIIDGEMITRAAELARVAAQACWAHGRPLAAGLLSLDWPEPAHLSLWHGITISREFRGDGHVAALLTRDVGPMQALLLHAGEGKYPGEILRAMRAWSEPEWNATRADLQAQDLLSADGLLTDKGRALRDGIEASTDALAMAPWEALGQEGCDELRDIGKQLRQTLVDGGAFSF